MRSYYDEFGVSAHAPAEDIREAYRNLVRLLHPDQQTEGSLKEAAEHQMKRLNFVNAVLSDQEKRRRYDSDCALAHERSHPIIFHAPPPPPPPRSPFGTMAWVSAALVGGALISWLVTRESASALPDYAETPAATAPREPVADKGVPAEKTRLTQALENVQIATLRTQLRAADEERALLLQELARLRGEAKPKKVKAQAAGSALAAISAPGKPTRTAESAPAMLAGIGSPPPLSNVPLEREPAVSSLRVPDRTADLKIGEASRRGLTGLWFYARPKLQHVRKAFYPPEYIEANIIEENGSIRGRYRARYQVTDRAISPDVNFEFDGKGNGSSANLAWRGGGGSKGELQLKLISETSLEVVWSATQLGRTLGLAAGSAVLVRRAEP